MRNNISIKNRDIFILTDNLPYFSIDNFFTLQDNKNSLKMFLSRYEETKKVTRIKKGIYVNKKYLDYLEKRNKLSIYTEFITNFLYQPSYLSLEYVLYENNLLTELPTNFTSVTTKKTSIFSNHFGTFIYHKIKDSLFCGFTLKKTDSFTIYKASKSKALFDYLYLRKNLLSDRNSVEELRLNLNNLNKKDIKELKKYVNLESSVKMSLIFSLITDLWK
jgi:predicted transcriptional regulator of viral defense system